MLVSSEYMHVPTWYQVSLLRFFLSTLVTLLLSHAVRLGCLGCQAGTSVS